MSTYTLHPRPECEGETDVFAVVVDGIETGLVYLWEGERRGLVRGLVNGPFSTVQDAAAWVVATCAD